MALNDLVFQVKKSRAIPEIACLAAGFFKGYADTTGTPQPTANLAMITALGMATTRGTSIGAYLAQDDELKYLPSHVAKGTLQGAFVGIVAFSTTYYLGCLAGQLTK